VSQGPASAASIRSLWVMRFINGKGVAEWVARVALLHACVLAQEFFCGNLRRAA
jgi:hypothetical protein